MKWHDHEKVQIKILELTNINQCTPKMLHNNINPFMLRLIWDLRVWCIYITFEWKFLSVRVQDVFEPSACSIV